ncbi:tetratricopeptide repeat protein [Bradyrhizobium sp. 27S5]|uniref:tetratricopeptide repeat protein n=1 Tax=Bradyrhizobium sp. 27S5 TaxID=3139728 RepID=UPI0030D0D571
MDGVDLSGQDVTGMEFTTSGIFFTTADESTGGDTRYVPRFDLFEDDWTQYSSLDFGNKDALLNSEDFVHLGDNLTSRGEHNLAAALYLAATARFPLDHQLWLRLGQSLSQNRDLPKAIRIHYDIVQKFPAVERARTQLATLLQGRGNVLEAANILREATQVFPASAALWAHLVDLLSTIDVTEALSAQRSLHALYPDDLSNWQKLASLYLEAGDTKRAIASYRGALSKFQYSPTLVQGMATTLRRHHQYTASIELFEEIIARYPKQIDAYRWLADAYSRKGAVPAAKKILDRAIRKFPTNPTPWKWLGDTLRKHSDTRGSIAAYKKAIKLSSEDSGPWKWLGRAYEEEGHFEKAIKVYEEAVRATPDVAPNKWLSDLMERTGRTNEAIDLLHKARRRHPDDPTVWRWLFEVLVRAKHPSAKNVRREALAHFRTDPRFPKLRAKFNRSVVKRVRSTQR